MKARLFGLAAATAVVGGFTLDAHLHSYQEADCYFEFQPGAGVQRGVLTVYAPGMICPAYDSIKHLRPQLLAQGDLLLVHYGRLGADTKWTVFNSDMVVRQLVKKLREIRGDYTRIVLLGASLGGRVLYDVAWMMRDAEFDWVPVCSPMAGAQDIRMPLQALAPLRGLLRPGPLLNQLDLLKKVAIWPKPENVEPSVDWDELMTYARKCYDYRLSFYADQVRYALGGKPVERLANIGQVVAVRGGKRDDLVRPEAADRILDVFRDGILLEDDRLGHVSFREQPKAWGEMIARTYQTLRL